jgi:hypothetical protein
MSHDTHVIDGVNKDIGFMSPDQAKEHYLELAEGWTMVSVSYEMI